MRYVSGLPPLTAPAESEEPLPMLAVGPVSRVGQRTRVPRVIQRFKRKAGKPGEAAEEAAVFQQEKRSGSDRRVFCRRLQHTSPFLDTRSGVERRKKVRRRSDVVTSLDEEG